MAEGKRDNVNLRTLQLSLQVLEFEFSNIEQRGPMMRLPPMLNQDGWLCEIGEKNKKKQG